MQQSEEARRYVFDRVMAGDLRASQAAEILGVSERHAWRLLAAYRARGTAALEHGNSGRRPHNAVAADVASAVVRFASTRYPGANHIHLAELLWEHEDLDVSSWTVRRILARAGIASPRQRRPPEHRVRRERMPRAARQPPLATTPASIRSLEARQGARSVEPRRRTVESDLAAGGAPPSGT